MWCESGKQQVETWTAWTHWRTIRLRARVSAVAASSMIFRHFTLPKKVVSGDGLLVDGGRDADW
jgi:general secretion pathway protein L